MIIRTLTVFERDAVKDFYLALSADDRRKRFCSTVSDESICRYVERLDFARHTILGAFDGHAQLLGLAELAHGAEESEMAFSVRPELRRRGIATRLMQKLMLHARVCGMRRVLVLFLADNVAMRALAAHADMRIELEGGEAYASCELPEASAEERSRWLIEHAFAHGGYFGVLGIERWATLVNPHAPVRSEEAQAIEAALAV